MAWNLEEKNGGSVRMVQFPLPGQPVPVVKILIPHTGSWTSEFTERMLIPLQSHTSDLEKYVIFGRGTPLDVQRNSMVVEALKDSRTTHVLFGDSDMVCEKPPDPNDALKLLIACNAPIVSGLYRAKRRDGFPYAMWTKTADGGYANTLSWTPEGSNWVKVDSIGMGFCLIKREVFEKVPYPWFVWDNLEPSEDFYFCEKVKQYGYEVRVFTDVRLSHIGVLKVKSDGTVTVLDM